MLSSNRTFRDILQIAEKKKIDPLNSDRISNLLHLLYFHRNLKRFYLLLENVEALYPDIEKFTLESEWISAQRTLLSTQETVAVFMGNRDLFSVNLPDLDLNQKSRSPDKRRSCLNQIFKEARFWTALAYQPVQGDALPSFLKLLALIWLCRTAIQKTHAEGLIQDSLDSAMEAIRDLTLEKSSSEIFDLPVETLSPDEYLKCMRTFPTNSPVHTIADFIEDVIDILRNISAEPVKGNPSVVDGDLSDLTGPDLQPKIELPGIEPIGPRFGIIASRPTNRHLLQNVKGAQIRKWIAQKNQLFPFAGSAMSPHELMRLIQYLSPADKKPFTSEELEARAILALFFWGPLSEDRLSNIKLSEEFSNVSFQEDFYDPETGELSLVSPWPKISYSPTPEAAEQLHARQTWISHQLPAQAISCINSYLKHAKIEYGRIFPRTQAEVRNLLSSLITSLNQDSHVNLSLDAIRNTLNDGLSRFNDCDSTSAVLCSGQMIRRAETKVYYAAFHANDLVAARQSYCRDLLSRFGCHENNMGCASKRQFFLGTPKRPLTEAVRDIFTSLAEKEHDKEKEGVEGFIIRHNAYVAYVALVQMYSVGFREVRHPYIASRSYDPVTGFSALIDKDIEAGNHARPIWIPEVCRRQLESYREYIDRLVDAQETDEPAHLTIERSDKTSLFFLRQRKDRLAAIAVQPSSLGSLLESFGYHLPLNSQRHYLKSELQEAGCPPDVIELFLGHWEIGEEGYSLSSALNPHDYRKLLQGPLNALLKKIGIDEDAPLKGPRRPGWNFQISLKILPLNPGAQQRKKRANKKQSKKDREFRNELQGLLSKSMLRTLKKDHLEALRQVKERIPMLLDEHKREEPGTDEIERIYYGLGSKENSRQSEYKKKAFYLRLIKEFFPGRFSHLDLPPLPLILPPETSMVRSSIGDQLYEYRTLEKALVKDIEGDKDIKPEKPNDETFLGQIYISAILFGGILSDKWAQALPNGLAKRIYLYNDLMWVDLWSDGDPPTYERERFLAQMDPTRYRRWIPDPVTQTLIIRWRKICPQNGQSLNVPKLDAVLRDFLKSHKISIGENVKYATQLSYFLKLSTSAALIKLPPFMVAYAKNLMTSASLPDERWLRIVSGQSVAVPELRKNPHRKYLRSNFLLSSQKKLRLKLCQIILPAKAKDRGTENDAIARIDHFIASHPDACPVVQLLSDWAIFLLSRREYKKTPHKKRNPLAMTTVAGYVSAVGDLLIETFRWQNPIFLDERVLFDIYKKLENNLKDKSKARGKKLAESGYAQKEQGFVDTFNFFHWYLEVCNEAAYAPASGLIQSAEDGKRVNSQVSSQLILPEEYRLLLASYNFHNPDRSRLDTIACCILILAYRMGLRRMEILGLRIKDTFLDPLEVRVSKHAGRRTKSKQATRKLPWYLPMPEDELDFFVEWVLRREKEGVKPTSYLLTETEFVDEMLDDHALVPKILEKVKEITLDPGTVLHHCRDSFITNLMVQSIRMDEIPSKSSPAFVEQGSRPRGEYWDAVSGNTGTGRNRLHAIAMLAGHADVKTGMHSYMHLADWLLGYLSRHPENSPQLSGKAVAKLFGVSEPQGRNLRREQGYPFLDALSNRCEKVSGLSHPKLKVSRPLSEGGNTTKKEKVQSVTTSPLVAFDEAVAKVKTVKRIKCELAKGNNIQIAEALYGDIKRAKHGSTAKKMIRIANTIESQLKIGVLTCKSYGDTNATDLVWLLDKIGLDHNQIKVSFHFYWRWTEDEYKKGERQLDRWSGRVPGVKIDVDRNKTKSKNGALKIAVKGLFEVLISLLARSK